MKIFGFLFSVLLFVSFITYSLVINIYSVNVDNVKITGKERITTKDDSKYLIYTENEVFENTDSILHWKFNSSDFYGKFREGQVCTLSVTGVRNPLFSMYRNIVAMECY